MRTAVEELDGVASVRGRGLLLGVELAGERPATEVVDAGMAEGLVLGTAGATSLRIAPPLIISDDEIAHGVAVLDKVLKS